MQNGGARTQFVSITDKKLTFNSVRVNLRTWKAAKNEIGARATTTHKHRNFNNDGEVHRRQAEVTLIPVTGGEKRKIMEKSK